MALNENLQSLGLEFGDSAAWYFGRFWSRCIREQNISMMIMTLSYSVTQPHFVGDICTSSFV